jgi:hypothetical protein
MAGDAGSRPIYIRQGVAEIIGIAEATVKTCMFYAEEAGRVGRDRVVGVSPSSHLRCNSRRM